MTVQEIQVGLCLLVILAVAVLFSIISLLVKRRKQAMVRPDPEVWPPNPPETIEFFLMKYPESHRPARSRQWVFPWLKRKG